MKIDLVIKVGGSLGRWRGVGRLLDLIARCRGTRKVLVVPGGGVFADVVRVEDRLMRLTKSAAHKMAILAMDQYGLLLCDLASHAVPVYSLRESATALRSGQLPIFLPSRHLSHRDPFDHSWAVTSDSVAAHVARLVGATTLLLLKSVDGVFAGDPRSNPDAPLLPRVTRSQLPRYGVVDREFAKWVKGIDACWIINGRRPARVKQWLETGTTLGTCTVMR